MGRSLSDLVRWWRASERQVLLEQLAALTGQPADPACINALDADFAALHDPLHLAWGVLMSEPGVRQLNAQALALHLHAIHRSRIQMVSHLLPPGARILDLGGAHCPLYRMGYPHAFDHLSVVDLPAPDRHEAFRNNLPAHTGPGRVDLLEADMTRLEGIATESVDLVWSGQSIEHIALADAERMCKGVMRVLRPGGAFCLDTPNRLLTRLHTADIGGGFIHPDHRHEYTPEELRHLLQQAGFDIVARWGVQDMPLSSTRGRFDYQDFMLGGSITATVDTAYVQFFHCQKPWR